MVFCLQHRNWTGYRNNRNHSHTVQTQTDFWLPSEVESFFFLKQSCHSLIYVKGWLRLQTAAVVHCERRRDIALTKSKENRSIRKSKNYTSVTRGGHWSYGTVSTFIYGDISALQHRGTGSLNLHKPTFVYGDLAALKEKCAKKSSNIKEWRISYWWLIKHHSRWDWIHPRSAWAEHWKTQKHGKMWNFSLGGWNLL